MEICFIICGIFYQISESSRDEIYFILIYMVRKHSIFRIVLDMGIDFLIKKHDYFINTNLPKYLNNETYIYQ